MAGSRLEHRPRPLQGEPAADQAKFSTPQEPGPRRFVAGSWYEETFMTGKIFKTGTLLVIFLTASIGLALAQAGGGGGAGAGAGGTGSGGTGGFAAAGSAHKQER
jgi:hypothetical protein